MPLQTVVLFALGFVLLIGGAEVLVRGASRLAVRLRMTPLLVGLTVVALGTSAPEIAVGVDAARSGFGGLAVGNVVGSNIFNVLCVLGLAGLAAPLVVPSQLVHLDVPIMIGCTALVVILSFDRSVGTIDGVLLLGLGCVYLVLLARLARSGADDNGPEAGHLPGAGPPSTGIRGLPLELASIVGGLVLLTVGSGWLVDGAVAVARAANVSPTVVGLTIVAAGTSLPEVATSVVAALRGARDLAVGNVVGSNISNLLLVLGLAAVVAPDAGLPIPGRTLIFDFPVMLAVSVACLPIFFTGHRISRWEASVFLAYYGAYLTFLILDATGHHAEHPFVIVLLGFVIPLTMLTMAVITYRELRSSRPIS